MNKNNLFLIFTFLVLILAAVSLLPLTLAGCSTRIGYVGNSFSNTIKASFVYFNGIESKSVKFKSGDKVTIKYSILPEEGSLRLSIKNSSGNIIATKTEGTGEISFPVEETQKYTIFIEAEKAKGRFEVTWTVKN